LLCAIHYPEIEYDPNEEEFNFTYDEKDSEAELLLVIQGVQTIDESGTAGFVERTVDPETKAWSHSRGPRPVSIPIPAKDFETEEVKSRFDQAYILFNAKPSRQQVNGPPNSCNSNQGWVVFREGED